MYEKTYWNTNPSRSPILEKQPISDRGQDLQEIFYLVRDLTFPNLSRLHRLLHAERKSKGDEFKEVRGKKIDMNQDLLVREFSLNLQTFINICRARGIIPVLMTQASRLKDHPDPPVQRIMHQLEISQGITYGEFKGAFDRLNQTIREVGAKNQVLVIDLAQEIPPVKKNTVTWPISMTEGSRLVALALRPISPCRPSCRTAWQTINRRTMLLSCFRFRIIR